MTYMSVIGCVQRSPSHELKGKLKKKEQPDHSGLKMEPIQGTQAKRGSLAVYLSVRIPKESWVRIPKDL